MTVPDLCCTAGGAITFWLRVINCTVDGGILATMPAVFSRGFRIFCEQFRETFPVVEVNDGLTYVLAFASGFYRSDVRVPSGSNWLHITMNFLGLGPAQGIRIYQDGELVGSDSVIATISLCSVGERLIVGRFSTGPYVPDRGAVNTSFHLDELMFYNQALTQAEIRRLSQ